MTNVWITISVYIMVQLFIIQRGWSVCATVWVSFQCRDVLLIWSKVGQGPTVLAVGAGGGLFGNFFSRLSFLFSFSLSLGDGPIQTGILSQRAVKPKTTNQPFIILTCLIARLLNPTTYVLTYDVWLHRLALIRNFGMETFTEKYFLSQEMTLRFKQWELPIKMKVAYCSLLTSPLGKVDKCLRLLVMRFLFCSVILRDARRL